MTREQILQEIQDINTDAATYIYNEDYKSLNSLVNSVHDTYAREDGFYDVLRLFRLVNIPFSIAGYNYVNEDVKDEIWQKYEPIVHDMVIYNISLKTFLSAYGFSDEYKALSASSNERKIYINTIKKRIDLINDYTDKYHQLVKLYDPAQIAQIHNSKKDTETIQNRFTDAVAELVKAREKFFYYINYDLVGEDVKKLNKDLKQKKTNKERFDMLKNITDNAFTTLKNNSNVDFRDFFIIKDNRKVKFSTYIDTKGMTSNSWFNYKRAEKKDFPIKRDFYLQMAFFLGIPTSNEIERFLNYNGHSIKSPFQPFPESGILDYDLCRYIDAGIDYNLINSMLGFSFI